MLVSSYIITHAAQQNLLENRNNTNFNFTNQLNIDYLMSAIEKIYAELEKLKNEH